MSQWRSLLLYFADGHSIALATLFVLFAGVIALCSRLGSEEAALRRATAPARLSSSSSSSSFSSVSSPSAFRPLPFSSDCWQQPTSVVLVTLTETDMEVLNGGPLVTEGTDNNGGTEVATIPTAAAAMRRRRWARLYARGDITFVRLPTLPALQSTARRWLAEMNAHCGDGRRLLPVVDRSAEQTDQTETTNATGTHDDVPLPLLPLCSRVCNRDANKRDNQLDEKHAVRGKEERSAVTETECIASGVDALVLDTLPPYSEHDPGPASAAEGCGLVVLLTPAALRSPALRRLCSLYSSTHHQVKVNSSVDGAAETEACWMHTATAVWGPAPDPSFASSPSLSPSVLPSSTAFTAVTDRRGRVNNMGESAASAEMYKLLGANVAGRVLKQTGYRPRFVVYVAWCATARTYDFHSGSGGTEDEAGPQPLISVVCVKGNEALEINAAWRQFARVRDGL